MLDETQPASSSKKKKTKTQNEVVCFACEHCGAKFNKSKEGDEIENY